MEQLSTHKFVTHLLSCGKFSTLELMWISGTNVQRQRSRMRSMIQELMSKGMLKKEFSGELKKSLYRGTEELKSDNIRPADRDIIFKARDRAELIDFIRSIYEKFGFLPDTVKETEVYYYSQKR